MTEKERQRLEDPPIVAKLDGQDESITSVGMCVKPLVSSWPSSFATIGGSSKRCRSFLVILSGATRFSLAFPVAGASGRAVGESRPK